MLLPLEVEGVVSELQDHTSTYEQAIEILSAIIEKIVCYKQDISKCQETQNAQSAVLIARRIRNIEKVIELLVPVRSSYPQRKADVMERAPTFNALQSIVEPGQPVGILFEIEKILNVVVTHRNQLAQTQSLPEAVWRAQVARNVKKVRKEELAG